MFRYLLPILIIISVFNIAFSLSSGETQISSTVWFRYFITCQQEPIVGKYEFIHSHFNVGRGYFQLSHAFNDRFSGTFLINVLTDPSYSASARIELKLAMVSMNLTDNIRVRGGVIPFEFGLESIWKYRIIPLSLAGERRFIPSCDFGSDITIKLANLLNITTQITNGEGYLSSGGSVNDYPAISTDIRLKYRKVDAGVSAVFEKNGGLNTSDEQKNRFVIEPFFRIKLGKVDLMAEMAYASYAKDWGARKSLGYMVSSTIQLNPFIEPVARFDIFDPNSDVVDDRMIQFLGGVNLYLYHPNEGKFAPNIVFQPEWRLTTYQNEDKKPTYEILMQLQFNFDTQPF